MDSNGQRFWLALGGTPWVAEDPEQLDRLPGHLRLASHTIAPGYPEISTDAEARLKLVPMAGDSYGTRAFLDADRLRLRATGAIPPADLPRTQVTGEVPAGEEANHCPVIATSPEPVTDLALGFDGHLYYATAGALRLQPLSDRFTPQKYSLAGFSPWRLACAPNGQVWMLDRTHRSLGRLTGKLWPEPPAFQLPPPAAFLPEQDNPQPPVLSLLPAGWLAADEDPVALAISPAGRVAVLVWSSTGARVKLIDEKGRAGSPALLGQVKKPYSLAWLSADRFAVLAAGVAEAITYTWREGPLVPSGEIYPLRYHDGGPFLHRTDRALEYATITPPAGPAGLPAPRPLIAIAQTSLGRVAQGTLSAPLDSGTAGTAWHRLYVDASLPPGTSFTLYAAVSDTEENPAGITAKTDWHPHHFGPVPTDARGEPAAAWVPFPSEIPGDPGFAELPRQRDHNGLFTVLLQRSNRPVRTLTGRFLHLRIELRGDLRSTPCLRALRAYGPRFSYQNKYLPALYRETVFAPEAELISPDRPATATRADFLGRLLANFEGILTPIEDKIADSWLVTDPGHTPDPAVEWLGSWIGVAFAPWYPPAQRRLHIRKAPELYRRRGTLKGLRLALDIATAGGEQQGRIVVVEDFWFRRTLQTVLGVNLDREDDPLLGGAYVSGNSKVGDTLFLSEEGAEKKFLALFDASIALKAADRAVVEEFFASLAHRVTIIVHETAGPDEMTLIERVAALEAPAHLVIRVRAAQADFMIGLAALIGKDTYLRPRPAPEPVEVGDTVIGGGSLLLRPLSLDPRLTGQA